MEISSKAPLIPKMKVLKTNAQKKQMRVRFKLQQNISGSQVNKD
jgi:hypothetical protein